MISTKRESSTRWPRTESTEHLEVSGENTIRSIAAELALVSLSELEGRIEGDPELLVSSEAILAFAAIRRADPERWDHWYRILAKYQKAEVVEYMLSEPVTADAADWQAKAARLVAICL